MELTSPIKMAIERLQKYQNPQGDRISFPNQEFHLEPVTSSFHMMGNLLSNSARPNWSTSKQKYRCDI